MLELLLLFTFWPWALFALLLVGFGVSAATESTLVAAISLIIYVVVTWLAFGVNPVAWIIANPGSAVLLALLYVCVGIVWSLFKWRDHLTSARIQGVITDAKEYFKKKGGTDTKEFRSSEHFPAQATPDHNKSRIVNWIALWPFSAFMFVFYDLLSRFFSRLYDALSGAYESLTSRYIP